MGSNLSASERKRRWPDERFITVIQRAQGVRPDLAVRVISLPTESESARKVAEAVGGVGCHVDSWDDEPETHGAEVWNLLDEGGHLDPVVTVAQFGVLQRCPIELNVDHGLAAGP